jgi:hypothetical protein
MIIVSEAEAFENTPKRYDGDSTKKQDTKIPNNDCNITTFLGNSFSLIRIILSRTNFL